MINSTGNFVVYYALRRRFRVRLYRYFRCGGGADGGPRSRAASLVYSTSYAGAGAGGGGGGGKLTKEANNRSGNGGRKSLLHNNDVYEYNTWPGHVVTWHLQDFIIYNVYYKVSYYFVIRILLKIYIYICVCVYACVIFISIYYNNIFMLYNKLKGK